ncbi:MAG: IS1634 family transposase [Burkholderiaceae bacterium]
MLSARCMSGTLPMRTTETTAETVWERHRLVIAHDPVRAAEQTAKRDATIKALEDQAAQWVGKLDGQDAGDARAGGHCPMVEHGPSSITCSKSAARSGSSRSISKSELFTYSVNRKARQLAELMDGKLLLVSNVAELKAQEIVERYKSLADIERGFRVLKSEIEIGPVHHRLPDRIRAHASLCFIALILHRVMRMRLRQSPIAVSPERALEHLRRIQHHEVYLGETLHRGVTTVNDEQRSLLASLGAPTPDGPEQLALL